MVSVQHYSEGCGAKFIILPNKSLTWKQALIVYLFISVFCISVALWFAVSGLWLELPFTGLEVLILGFAFYACAKRSSNIEVVGIHPDTIYIESGRIKPESRHEFKTAWVKISILKSKYKGYPSRLTIGSQDKAVEIGAALIEEERLRLAKKIRKTIKKLRFD